MSNNNLKNKLLLTKPDKEKPDELDELKRLKTFILFKLADLQRVHYQEPSKAEKTLNTIKKEVASYTYNSYCFPSTKTIEGKIKRTLIRQKLNIEED